MATVRELIAKVGFSVDQASAKRADGAMSKIKTAAKAAVGVFLTAKAAGAVKGIVDDVRQLGDHLDKVSQRLGVSAQNLQKLEHAAELSGVSTSQLATGMQQLQRQAYNAARGSKESEDAFRALGVAVKDSSGNLKDPTVLMSEVAGGLNRVQSESERTALAMTVFGRAGATLKPLLKAGAEGINAMGEEVEALGATMSEDLIQQSVDLTDNLTRIQRVIQGVKNVIASKLMPPLNAMLEAFTAWWKVNGEIIRLRIGQAVEYISGAFSAFWDVFRVVLDGWWQLWNLLGDLTGGIGQIAVAFALLAAVLGGPATILLLLVAAFQDIYRWATGDGKTAMGELVGDFDSFKLKAEELWGVLKEDPLGSLSDAFGWLAKKIGITEERLQSLKEILGEAGKLMTRVAGFGVAVDAAEIIEGQKRTEAAMTPEARARVAAQRLDERLSAGGVQGAINNMAVTLYGVRPEDMDRTAQQVAGAVAPGR